MAFLHVIWRESIYIATVARALWRLRAVTPESKATIVDIVEGWARRTPDAPGIMFADRTISYAALNRSADRVAHWARTNGIRRGDCVALLMENRPEYVVAWLGLLKLGAIASFINCNLRGNALAHCISACETGHLIVERELGGAYAEARPHLLSPPEAWVIGGTVEGCKDLDSELAAMPDAPADPRWRDGAVCADTAFYIFTSGTTGLPKAAKISHLRMLFMMHGFSAALNTRASDRVYNVLPMYHSAGGICAPGMAFTVGGTLVLRRRLSVQAFWDDCVHYRVTVFQYIGELCRYLLNAPVSSGERAHVVRAIIGNGLRPDIWSAFQTRFAIPRIVEFYGATEGNVALVNYDGKVGAVGRIPRYARNLFTTRIVRFDMEHEVSLRDANGFCIECADNEIGEAIGKISTEPGKRFEGYAREADTQKKILRHVFEADDAWFRTGDLLRRDRDGYFYFVDRIGDTFRWKGENVATSEVAEALSAIRGVREANVYGVSVPGQDGRAGMAALVVTADFRAATLANELAGRLPTYARPLFVRLMPEIGITGTFKHRKIDLVEEGFDRSHVANPLFVFNAQTKTYEPLDDARYADIVAGRFKI
ncbi:MAG TPA: long-chain-acyl-CoA synthetase [Rhizomicrobium sp.]|jgi:fatty-acyl-CoA synthase|nr:long-chain-acyl-CoA synthetase [Rhizomicrobium sp.]